MAYLLDTDIVIYAMEGVEPVLQKLVTHAGSVLTSSLNMAELQRGIFKRPALTATRQARLGLLMHNIPVLPFDTAAAEAYGQIIALCGWVKGRDFDRMIAAHAISARAVLVTNNAGDFADIPSLAVENWATG